MQIYVITDTHFFHQNIIKFCNRPENHNELMIKNWKEIVQWNDVVIHLGDVIFGNKEKLTGVLSQLPGKKILVKGNHDRETNTWYMNAGFDFACNQIIYNNIVFTHTPIQELPAGTKLNIHGHFHTADPSKWEYKVKPFNKLLIIEHEEYKPVLLTELLKRYE
jgi:calcineurin-like phosphoesterase family protein